ncbi:MAG: SagB/ThcOx family dehydrogenase [Candidatus Freyarchaeota archaeon]|nr:SagB/ThcOx family dehydrogenase [Candidatus Jordarchaeia archaeon]MBS7280332.1 SagB/ThcOx family dehydrogenase [Candidatus Jordarchaeia archaeon]
MNRKWKNSNYGALGVGDIFQQETKYTPEKLREHSLDWSHRPPPFKNHESPISKIALPEPEITGGPNLWTVLNTRRSRRTYDAQRPIRLETLSVLLWANQGVTAIYGDTYFRTAPSAGGLYPVETHLNIRLVEGLEPGIYHFRPQAFDLEFLKKGDYSRELAEAALGQLMVMNAQLTFIWTAILGRSKWKYGQRAYRYVYLDAGHIAQNLYLAGEAVGLGVCAIGALFDEEVNRLIGVDGISETVIYMASVGWPKNRTGLDL